MNRERGKAFEERIDASLEYYRSRGFAAVEKTPEPMKPLKDLGQGKFIACYATSICTTYARVTTRLRSTCRKQRYPCII